MAYRVIKVDNVKGPYLYYCYGCEESKLALYGFDVWTSSLLWHGYYCDECTRSMDIIYDYYLEVQYRNIHRTYYDVEIASQYHHNLIPSLTKI